MFFSNSAFHQTTYLLLQEEYSLHQNQQHSKWGQPSLGSCSSILIDQKEIFQYQELQDSVHHPNFQQKTMVKLNSVQILHGLQT